ncbi:HEAT repeat domain-containing protein [Polyangium spumosum]|uniref:HEAT repeat domain-containing protein n=1 Tax=Polyangium spumosum TaxID=889282 RepID=A0A6N7Q3A7_9BACT|nr:HEAT repeat domain-containing protein [Polyangium spumosum]MRG98177.1 hypothetical protein [Polyangium spumosum]
MDGWETLLVWKFKGPRFDDHGIELRDLAVMVHLRETIVEAAKQVWRQENPDSKRLPDNFEDSIVLKIFEIGKGSAALAIRTPFVEEAPAQPDKQQNLPQVETTRPRPKSNRPNLRKAVAHVALASSEIVGGKVPATDISQGAARHLRHITGSLGPDEAYEVEVPVSASLRHDLPANTNNAVETTKAASLPEDAASGEAQAEPIKLLLQSGDTKTFADYSSKLSQQPLQPSLSSEGVLLHDAEDPVNVVGTITRADIERHDGAIKIDGHAVPIEFTPEQEAKITKALYLHASTQLQVIGRGRYDRRNGTLLRITRVDQCVEVPFTEAQLELAFGQDGQDPSPSIVAPPDAADSRVESSAPAEHQTMAPADEPPSGVAVPPDAADTGSVERPSQVEDHTIGSSREPSPRVVEPQNVPEPGAAEPGTPPEPQPPDLKDLAWEAPCEAMFEHLAQHDPGRLLKMLEDGSLRPGHLTHAAEAAGAITESAIVAPVLLRLLGHKSPLVREGALYGLASHLTEEVMGRIRAVAESDPIEEVQDAARSVLEDG